MVRIIFFPSCIFHISIYERTHPDENMRKRFRLVFRQLIPTCPKGAIEKVIDLWSTKCAKKKANNFYYQIRC